MNWRKYKRMLDINDLIKKLKEQASQQENYTDSILMETMGSYQSPQPSLKIDPKNILSFLDLAIPMQNCPIDEGSFYVFDLSGVGETSYNTLVFQLFGSPLKTTETTSVVMERYFQKCKMSYGTVKFLANLVGITQKCPYVIGNKFFAPDKGTSKNHANWIAIHHVKEVENYGNQSILSIRKNHELILNLTLDKVYKMAENVKLITRSQQKMMQDYLSHWNVRASTKKADCIIDKIDVKLPKILPNVLSYQSQLVHVQALQMLSTLFKEGDPYLDQLKENFPHLKNKEI